MIHLEEMSEAKKSLLSQEKQQGFVLVTVIVLLAILSIIGTVSLFKSNIEIKVSEGSVVSAQAIAAAEAGLAHNFAYWKWNDRAGETSSGTAEQTSVASAANQGTATTGIYDQTLTGTTPPLDTVIQGSAAYRVYNISATGMALVANNNTWATVNTPQVAVWATRYNKQASPKYPYDDTPVTGVPTAGNGCPDCNVVVYALGRSGTPGRNDSRRMLREIQMSASSLLKGVSALSNAPAYATWQDACDGTHTAVPAGGKDKNGNTPTPTTSPSNSTIDWVIEATQAEYALGKTPSGIAFASNTSTGPGKKSFRKGNSTTTVATMDSDPMLVYSGHGTTTGVKADLMSTTQDTTTPNAPDLPANKLPRRLVDQPLIGTPNVLDFFDPADPNKQLFNLDAYRWAAEQFTCQKQGRFAVGTTAGAVATSTVADGKFCGKGEALRLAVDAMGYPAKAPVTGRLSMAEFEYNVANGIPMFGMVRVMYPVYQTGTSFTCSNATPNKVYLYDTQSPTTGMYLSSNAADYTGDTSSGNIPAFTLDDDGNLGPKTKLIVYGSILYDFFTDFNGNGKFDPAVSKTFGSDTFYEHLVSPFEAVDARMELELLDTVNPALPSNLNAPNRIPTAYTGGLVAQGSNSSSIPVNLASPIGGWFPSTEGIPSVSTSQLDGAMALMSTANGKSILNKLMDGINTAGGLTGTALSNVNNVFTNTSMHTRLDYYYQLMKASAKQSDANSWPMDNFPSTMSDNFCIGSADCGTSDPATMTNNDGDKIHLMFPSGYTHGWKVALAALNLKASDWNGLLTGIVGLEALHRGGNGGYGYSSGDTAYPKGSPFNMKVVATVPIDPGSVRTAELTTGQNKYFKVDSGTGGYGLLTSNWKDIPAQMYAGGLVDIHHASNISGVTYTPGPLEWESGNNSLSAPDLATGYFNGSIITGFGAYNENAGTSYAVLVYDNQAVDNLNTNTTTIVMQRSGKEGL